MTEIVADNRFKTCSACGKKLFGNSFRKLSSRPTVRHDVCMPCERVGATLVVPEEAVVLAGKVEERREAKQDRETSVKLRARQRKASRARVKAKEKARLLALKDNDAAKELARRELARRSLLQYITQFDPAYQAGWVHEDICRRLERFLDDVRAGKGPRLIIQAPPRHGKSRIVSQELPSWALGKHPEIEVIACSYGVSLPLGFSRDVRARVRDPVYQAIFAETRVDPESQNVEGWATTAGGGFRPAGVGGGITGHGADCFPAGTMVTTEAGRIDIAHLYRLPYQHRVLAYNHGAQQLEWRRIVAAREITRDDLVEIETAHGRRIVATTNHPFFVPGRGYTEARLLESGSALLISGALPGVRCPDGPTLEGVSEVLRGDPKACGVPELQPLRSGVRADQTPIPQGREARLHRCVLLEGMLPGTSRRQEREAVPPLRQTDAGQDRPGAMFGEVPASSEAPTLDQTVRRVRDGVSAGIQPNAVLRQGVCAGGAFEADGRGRQLELPGRGELRSVVRPHETSCVGARSAAVCGVPSRGVCRGGDAAREGCRALDLPCAPHRREPTQQPTGEPRGVMQVVPHYAPQIGLDTVAVVRRLRQDSVRVYDLQVEGARNFFANEILVHNCLIVDDPFKDAEEADSETIRQSVWNWWGSTAYTRLSPKSGALVMNTRWNDDDLCGRLIAQMHAALREIEEVCGAMQAEGASAEAVAAYRAEQTETVDRWEVVSYPAIAETDEYLTSDHKTLALPAPGARLLRRKGDALHPARYPISRLRRIKRALQPRHWAALYQQNPIPDEGSFFTKDMIRYAAPPNWRELPIVIAGDLAIGKNQTNDWTVFGAGCVDFDDRLHVLDVVRGRMNTFEIVEALLDLYARFRGTSQSVTIGVERGQLQMAIWPVLEKRMQERKLFPSFDMELKPVTDKLVRARPLQGLMQHGQVVFPPGQPWTEPVTHELLRFPSGVFDDCVDMMAWMARMRSRVFAPRRPKPQRLKSWKDKLTQYVKQPAGGGSAMAA